MENRLRGTLEGIFFKKRTAGIQIAIVVRKVAARDFNSKAMPGFDNVAGRPQVDRIFVDFARSEQRRMGL